jgi:hypothetical protein
VWLEWMEVRDRHHTLACHLLVGYQRGCSLVLYGGEGKQAYAENDHL